MCIRDRRLLVPFAFWAVFYAFFRLVKAHGFGYEQAIFDQLGQWQTWAGYMLLGNSQYHLHFLPTLFLLAVSYTHLDVYKRQATTPCGRSPPDRPPTPRSCCLPCRALPRTLPLPLP